jgi:hypothetical protein
LTPYGLNGNCGICCLRLDHTFKACDRVDALSRFLKHFAVWDYWAFSSWSQLPLSNWQLVPTGNPIRAEVNGHFISHSTELQNWWV